MANYNYFCNNHGEIILNLKFGTAKEFEECPLCKSKMERIYSSIPDVWKCTGNYNASRGDR